MYLLKKNVLLSLNKGPHGLLGLRPQLPQLLWKSATVQHTHLYYEADILLPSVIIPSLISFYGQLSCIFRN